MERVTRWLVVVVLALLIFGPLTICALFDAPWWVWLIAFTPFVLCGWAAFLLWLVDKHMKWWG